MSNEFYNVTGSPSTSSSGSSSVMRAEFIAIQAGFALLPTMTGNGLKIVGVNSSGTALTAVATTGTGSVVLATSPALITPDLGTPSAGVLTNCTGYPASSLSGTLGAAKGGTGVANNAASTLTISGNFATTLTVSGVTGVTLPTGGTLSTLAGAEAFTNKTYNGNTFTAGTGVLTIAAGKTATHNATTTFAGTDGKTLTISNTLTLSGTDASTLNIGTGGTLGTAAFTAASAYATLAGVEEFTNKTLNASVGKGTWTASGTWTLPALTLGGTVSGGGQQLNNIIIGTTTPLAGAFTTLSATGTATLATISATSTGQHLIKTSYTGDWSWVLQNTSATTLVGGVTVLYSGLTPNDTTHLFYEAEDSTARRFGVRSNGGIENFSANNANLSDMRVKHDWKLLDLNEYWDKNKKFEYGTFLYKDQTDSFRNLGMIAQTVEKIAPEFVDVSGFGKTPDDGVPLKCLWETDIFYMHGAVLQKAQFCIEDHETRIAALASENISLRAQLNAQGIAIHQEIK